MHKIRESKKCILSVTLGTIKTKEKFLIQFKTRTI